MVSALFAFRRLVSALRHAIEEEDFLPVLTAGATLILSGTLTYTLGNGWKLVDGFYFAVATLTTSSIADPSLVLKHDWMKVFTVFYILVGIGILVEIARRIGTSFVEVRHQHRKPRAEGKAE